MYTYAHLHICTETDTDTDTDIVIFTGGQAGQIGCSICFQSGGHAACGLLPASAGFAASLFGALRNIVTVIVSSIVPVLVIELRRKTVIQHAVVTDVGCRDISKAAHVGIDDVRAARCRHVA